MSGFLVPSVFNPPTYGISRGAVGQVLTIGTNGEPQFLNAGSLGGALGTFATAILPAGQVDNFNPVPIGPPAWPGTYGRIDLDTTAGQVTLTGMVAGYDGQVVWLRNSGTNNNDVIFAALDVGSLPQNQFLWYYNAICADAQTIMACYYGPNTGLNGGAGCWIFTGR